MKVEKDINVRFNGGETIHISGNADKEQILEVMTENMKPVLMGMINQEIFEEGDRSYNF